MKQRALPQDSLAARLDAQRIFGRLDPASREQLAAAWQCETLPHDRTIAEGAALQARLWLILQGEVTLRRADVQAHARLAAGDCFGHGVGPAEAEGWAAVTASDCALASVSAEQCLQWVEQFPLLGAFLAPTVRPEVTSAPPLDQALSLLTAPVRTLVRRAPVTLAPTATVLQAAQTMREHGVSSILLVEGNALAGIVTDRDLRNRALAAGLDPQRPVRDIATTEPWTVDAARPAFEALLLMTRHRIQHVPVLDGTQVVGMVTATDVTAQRGMSPVVLASEIARQTSVDGLAAAAAQVQPLQRRLAAADATAYSTGHIITAITDAITTRLLQLAELELGPAPLDYAWVAAGSQARSEQTARSDQDNCLILDNGYDEAAHGAYFKALAGFVNDGLDACGYVYCPGEMMARTDQWRQPQRRWAEYFRRWTDEPEPMALMLTCVFFDQRVIHGRDSLLDDLRRDVLRQTRDNRIFLAYMVGNALKHRPPLSMFGGISTERRGEVRDAVDLKHSGIVPIVDLARIYALAGGHAEVNTHDRLSVAAQSREISEHSAHDLRDALEFMAMLRLRHQARQTAEGKPPDNFLSLAQLSNFERGQLKDAFGVVQTLQTVLAQRYR